MSKARRRLNGIMRSLWVEPYGALGLFGTLFLTVIIEVLRPTKEPTVQLFLVSSLALLAMTLFISFQLLQMRSLTNARSEIRKAAKALEYQETEEGVSEGISEIFKRLEGERAEFEATVSELMIAFGGSQKIVRSQWRESLLKAQSSFLQGVCNAAVQVLATKKRQPIEGWAANIKVLVANPLRADSPRYQVIHRWPPDKDRDRDEPDDNRCHVFNNFYYSQILNPDDSVPDYYLLSDINVLLAIMLADKSNPKREPSEVARRHYCSAFVVPIMGSPRAIGPSTSESAAVVNLRKRSLIGFLCVDSKKPDVFDEYYDRSIMEQLAHMTYSVMTRFHGAMGLVEVAAEA